MPSQSDPSNPSALSTKEFIRNGEVIEFNCNADVVQLPSQFIQTNGLTILRQLHGSTEKVVVAIYTFGNFGKQVTNNPNSRDWRFDFNKPSNPTVSTRDSNIKWTMNDATCADAAMYECKVDYNGETQLQALYGHQNVSARAAVRNLFVTIDPQNANFRYSENDNVTMACTVEGPPGLLIVWRSGYPNSGLFQDYSVAADIVEDNPSPVSTDGCGAMMYRSSLRIMLTKNDDGLMYVCAARYDNDPELVDNITLSISPAAQTDPSNPSALSTKEFIRNGEVIEFNCNADVVQVPSQFLEILGLTISRQLHGSTEKVVVALYTFGNFGKPVANNPNSRDWTFDFKEPSNPTVSTRDSDIKWTMKDATCADSAMYECKVVYNGDAPLQILFGHQNVSARAAVRNLFVTIDPQNANFRYSENDNVTMACTVEGPPGLLIVWRSGYPNSGLFQDYSVAADIVEDNPSPVSTDACGAMMYRSSLSIMLTKNDDGLMYVCAARYDNDPELVDNITLSISPA
ncbi:hypothetical protein RRG08_025562, partial [Elysia crispata]